MAEYCSEFAFKESIRYLDFLDRQLHKEFRRDPYFRGVSLSEGAIFSVPYPNTLRLGAMHPGRLDSVLKDMVKKGYMREIGPEEGLFAD